MDLQGHTETPTHHPNTPKHHHQVHKPAKPEHSKPDHARREHGGGHQQRKEGQHQKRDHHKERSHKSAPETERTLPLGGGVRVRIPSLGALPITTRSH